MEGLDAVKGSVDGLLKLAESNAQREEVSAPPAPAGTFHLFPSACTCIVVLASAADESCSPAVSQLELPVAETSLNRVFLGVTTLGT